MKATSANPDQKAPTTGWPVRPHLLKFVSKTLAFALLICGTIEIWKADQTVVSGQILGMQDGEGVWVGFASGTPTSSSFQSAPYSDTYVAREKSKVTGWVFSLNGEFELRPDLDSNANLIVVSKNRVPIVTSVAGYGIVEPIEVHLLAGMQIEGVVQDTDGIPIAGATITLTPSADAYEIPTFALPTWVTGGDGSVHIKGLEAREYLLIAAADDYAPMIVPNFFIADTEVGRLEIELEKGYYITGQAVSENGVLIPDLEVFTSWIRSHSEVRRSAGVMKIERADRFGWYFQRTKTMTDGTYVLGPFENSTSGMVSTVSAEFGAAKVRGVRAPHDDLVLHLRREQVRGRVLDRSTGDPIKNFSFVYGEAPRTERVHSNGGHFETRVRTIDSKGMMVLIDSPGYFPWIGRLYPGSTGDYDLGDVLLERERILRGIVRDGETGEPMEGVHILRNIDRYADPIKRVFLHNWGQVENHRAITDENGEYLFQKLPRGDVRLDLIVPPLGSQTHDIPAEVREFDIDVRFDGMLAGSLVLSDGVRVDGEVELRGSTSDRRTVATNDGAFQWERLPPDTYTLQGETDAGLVRSRSVSLKAGERQTDFNLIVQPGWSASGTITGLSGNENVEVTVRDPDSHILIRKWFNNGPYAIHGVPKKAAIVAKTSTGLLLIRTFRDGNEGGSNIDFHFEDESQIQGSITSDGEPVRGMFLSIRPSKRGEVIGHTTTTASGKYVLKGLSDGSHIVRTRTGLLYAVEINGETTFDIELPRNLVSGIVRSEVTNSPIGGGLARLKSVNVPEATRPIQITERIGSDGTFLFEGLAAGEYDVIVAHPRVEKVSSRIQISGSESVEMFVQCANTQECFEGTSNIR